MVAEVDAVGAAEFEIDKGHVDFLIRKKGNCLRACRRFLDAPHAEARQDDPEQAAHMRIVVQDQRRNAFQSHASDVPQPPTPAISCLTLTGRPLILAVEPPLFRRTV